MKLIDRYIGREILITAFFAVGFLSFVLVIGNMFKLLEQLANHDLPLEYFLSFIAYTLPFSLTFTIPWGFLTAVLLVFGKLSGENELIALRCSGVSITRMCASLLVLVIICVGICLWIDLEVAPHAQQKMKSAIFDIATRNPLAMFSSDHIIDEFPGKKIYVEKKQGAELENILVYETDPKDNDLNPVRVLFAKKGELETDLTNQEMLLHIYDARYEQRDPDSPGDFTKIHPGISMKESVFSISLKELYEKNKRGTSPGTMGIKELSRTLNDLLNEEKTQKNETASLVASMLETSIRTERSKRFSFSLASFALVLIGVPLAITAHRKETSIGFLLSIVVAFSYFFFTQTANMAQNNPKLHPELLIWLPNVIFISLGSVLFWRLSRK